MPLNWRDEYLTSLQDAELSNPVNMELVQACSHMADRISAMEAERSTLEAQVTTSDVGATKGQTSVPNANNAGIAQLRLELAESLRSKGVTEARLRIAEEELDKLRSRAKSDSKSIRDLTVERSTILTRMKDREHELRGKKKLLEDVQDEMIGLELQLSMVEKEKDKVKHENKELVDRWMKRMAKEADAMNLANEPLFDNAR